MYVTTICLHLSQKLKRNPSLYTKYFFWKFQKARVVMRLTITCTNQFYVFGMMPNLYFKCTQLPGIHMYVFIAHTHAESLPHNDPLTVKVLYYLKSGMYVQC